MDVVKPSRFFGKAKTCDILRSLAYHNQDFDDTVVSIPTNRPRVTQTPCTNTCATLGDFDSLPLELFNEILCCSDLHTVSTFRWLNRRARVLVESSFPYKHILLNAPDVLAALEKTGIASHFSVDDVFRALSTPSCHVCSKFGTYLWIPECVRCCYPCMREAPELMPMSKSDAMAAFGLTKSGLRGLPIMAALPGWYGLYPHPYRKRRYFLSQERARQAAIDIHGEEELARYVNHGTSKAKIAYYQRVAVRDATDVPVEDGTPVGTKDHPTRFMTVVPLPYFDPSSRITHIGLSCEGCKFRMPRGSSEQQIATHVRLRGQTYTTKGIFEHFKRCPYARELWRPHRR